MLLPAIGLQTQFRKKKESATTRYERLLDPSFESGTTASVTVRRETTHKRGDDVPAWFWDTDREPAKAAAFSPRTAARDNLRCELRSVYADRVWEHRAGTVSEPLAAGERKQNAVKVIDERGNERLGVRELEEAEKAK